MKDSAQTGPAPPMSAKWWSWKHREQHGKAGTTGCAGCEQGDEAKVDAPLLPPQLDAKIHEAMNSGIDMPFPEDVAKKLHCHPWLEQWVPEVAGKVVGEGAVKSAGHEPPRWGDVQEGPGRWVLEGGWEFRTSAWPVAPRGPTRNHPSASPSPRPRRRQSQRGIQQRHRSVTYIE